uniref:Abnormal cell migration protein 18-like fibronectin type I domain-containing protein n=1 Tax=Angiostrongylus cantonensis TaxID=6313 RepID=A0A0K0DJ46_ANGCA
MFLILIVLPLFAIALNLTESKSSIVHFVQNISDINSMLEALPKECWKNGKTYKEGEEFQIGALRYKCQKYGVYTIEGCVTGKKKNLKIGEVVVVDNVKSQCMAKGDSVFFKETVCGILGQPECDKIPLPTGFQEATKIEDTKPKAKETNVPGLPPGWTMVDESHQEIPGTSAKHIISRTLVFHPVIQHARFV